MRGVRGTIPYVIVMGIVVTKHGLEVGSGIDVFLGVLSIPCAWIIWRQGREQNGSKP